MRSRLAAAGRLSLFAAACIAVAACSTAPTQPDPRAARHPAPAGPTHDDTFTGDTTVCTHGWTLMNGVVTCL